jgi:NAD(P)-dependent dehydrogenase (short-subunit alcohol dehydrogenase family)
MKKELAAVVTGGSGGIGLATAKLLKDRIPALINLDLKPSPAEIYARSYQVDFCDLPAVQAALDDLTSRYEVLHLINNVGFAVRKGVEETSLDDLSKCFEINLRSAVVMTQAVLPAMKAAGYGRIVNISSRAALGKELRTAYAAMKGGIISATRVWALELAPHGITVNAVAPGPVATEIFHAVNPPDHPATKALINSIPVKRVGTPEDIAHAVNFFMSEGSGFITGQTLYVCGGLTVSVAAM